MEEPKDKPQRRVYHFPPDLVDRILAFQRELGLASEAEAARRLIDEGLRHRDSVVTITSRLVARFAETKSARDAARDVLASHPLVSKIEFEGEGLTFTMANGFSVNLLRSGKAGISDEQNNTYDLGTNPPKWADTRHPRPGKGHQSLADAIDDDIPF